MTNHPRRAGRRKHQRHQDRRWTEITPALRVRPGTRFYVGPPDTQPPALGPTWGRTGRAG